MPHRPLALTRASRRIAFAAVLLVSLVLAQALGLMHGIAHMRHLPGTPGTATTAAGPAAKAGDSGWVAKLFAGHQHGGDCDVYDQLTHGDALHGITPAFAAVEFTQTPVALHRGWHIAAQSSGFLARGPPSLS
jgi:disulfide bond formation protein DsbB